MPDGGPMDHVILDPTLKPQGKDGEGDGIDPVALAALQIDSFRRFSRREARVQSPRRVYPHPW